MYATERLAEWLKQNPVQISSIVDLNTADRLCRFDLTAANKILTPEILTDAAKFGHWIDGKLAENNCRYGIGGYMELRIIYDSRAQFDTTAGERRNLHLGVDIWAGAGTAVYAPISGTIHSFRDNNNFGDYGPTIILQHNLPGCKFYTLYGHLSRANLEGLTVGQQISAGQQIATFGAIHENGNWPPHLHFQLMLDMDGNFGDYPGACRPSEREKYLNNIPDPELLLNFSSYQAC
jgi:peptidoglycan LD-endopeptidase LytH